MKCQIVYTGKNKKNVISLLSAESVKVNKYVSQSYSGHIMTLEQKSGTAQKKKGSYMNYSRPDWLCRLFKIIKLLTLCVKNIRPCKYALEIKTINGLHRLV